MFLFGIVSHHLTVCIIFVRSIPNTSYLWFFCSVVSVREGPRHCQFMGCICTNWESSLGEIPTPACLLWQISLHRVHPSNPVLGLSSWSKTINSIIRVSLNGVWYQGLMLSLLSKPQQKSWNFLLASKHLHSSDKEFTAHVCFLISQVA